MQKVRLLGIVPYEGMKLALESAASHRDDLELTVYVGNLEQGVAIAQEQFPGSYDLILSRGGTAEMIRTATGYPTVEIALSVYDIMRALRLSESFSARSAIVGFPNITKCAFLLKEILLNSIEVINIRSEADALSVLKQLKENGYQLVIGDMITSSLARQTGLQSILIESGSESIEETFDLAVQQYGIGSEYLLKSQMMSGIIHASGLEAVLFNGKQQVVFSSLREEKEALANRLRNDIRRMPGREEMTYLRRSGSTQYIVTGRIMEYDTGSSPAYLFTVVPNANADYTGIQFIDREDAIKRCSGDYANVSLRNRDMDGIVARFLRSNQPLLIEGEEGTGKDSLAYSLLMKAEYQKAVMLIADCSVIQERGWKYLFSHSNSPLLGRSLTVYFRDCFQMPQHYAWQLKTWLESGTLSKDVRCVFSTSPSAMHSCEHILKAYLLHSANSLHASLIPLRQSMTDLRNLVSLCINAINIELGRQVIGIEEDALAVLRGFHWPGNYTQFKQVLTQAVVITSGNLITRAAVLSSMPSNLSSRSSGAQDAFLFESYPSLREMEREIVKKTLESENYNQSKTAKRLKISRSTLWRILKQE